MIPKKYTDNEQHSKIREYFFEFRKKENSGIFDLFSEIKTISMYF